jgi:hypothetical protein
MYIYIYTPVYVRVCVHLCNIHVLKLRLQVLTASRLTAAGFGSFYFFMKWEVKCVVYSGQTTHNL